MNIKTGDVITTARGHALDVGIAIKVGDTRYRVSGINNATTLTYREWRWFDWLIPARLYRWWTRQSRNPTKSNRPR